MTPRVLIVYATTEGQTAKIAAALARTLETEGVTVRLSNTEAAADIRPVDYDAVIVAASVHAGTHQRVVRRWVARHAAVLEQRPNVFISVCLAAVNRNPAVDRELAAILKRFIDTTGWHPAQTKVVAGALKYRQYGWLKRWMMKRIVASHHGDTDTSRDYEYTDWDDLDQFARRFAEELRPAPVLASR